jgi:hypothetical protein
MHVHAAGGDVAGLRVAAIYDALSSPMIDRNAQRGPKEATASHPNLVTQRAETRRKGGLCGLQCDVAW